MKRILIATAVFALGSAAAADLGAGTYSKAPMTAAPSNSWAGWYAGGNVGYGWGQNAADINFTDTSIVSHSLKGDSKGIIGGAQLGYNFQWGSTVFGLETDIQGTGVSSSASVAPLPGASLAAGGDPTFASTDQKISWFGTTRARVGFSITPDLLLYGTGGAAYGGAQIHTDGIISPISRDHLLSTQTQTKVGWAAGAGAEWMFMRNWSARLEYLYLDLGSAAAFGNQGAKVGFGGNYTWTFKENIARAAVNYHF